MIMIMIMITIFDFDFDYDYDSNGCGIECGCFARMSTVAQLKNQNQKKNQTQKPNLVNSMEPPFSFRNPGLLQEQNGEEERRVQLLPVAITRATQKLTLDEEGEFQEEATQCRL